MSYKEIDKDEVLSDMALNTLTRIGNNVKFIRKSLLNKKLIYMAELTGVSRDVIWRLEALSSGEGGMGKGRVYPSLPTLLKFCDAIGIDMSDMLTVDIEYSSDIQSRIVSHCGISIDSLRSLESVKEEED